jgi:hypothetical protein
MMANAELVAWATFVAVALAAASVSADTLRSEIAFNNGIAQETAEQPSDGVRIAYQVVPTGDLQECTIDIVESLHPRDDGAWGFFDLTGDAKCADGGFAYHVGGVWDENGFHGSGSVDEGSGSGAFAGFAGRIGQGGGLAAGADGTHDVAYRLMIDRQQD